MADATTAPASGTQTPMTEVAPPSSTPAVDAKPVAPTSTPTSDVKTEVSPEVKTAPDVKQDVSPSEAPKGPLFTMPEGIKLADEATSKFETFLKPRLGADGKVSLTPQEVADQFIEQAKDANARWMKQIETRNQENEALCKSRFTAAQLSQAETAVGWASSIDPGFREFAKNQLNDPTFVNFMREIGERLSEDEFERGSMPSAPVRKGPMSRKEAGNVLYGKPKTN